MGFMTEISFLNDGWHELKQSILDDPQVFVYEIDVLMNGRPQYRTVQDGNLAQPRREYLGHEYPGDFDRLMHLGGGSTIYPSHHADEPRLYLAWQNSFINMDAYSLHREFGARLDNPNDHILDVLERDVKEAESILKETKKMLKEKRAALKVAV